MVILIKALQVILSLSLLIFLHELGHFMWAKLFGIRVEKFYLFFDAGGKSIAKWKWGETEFGIGWLPFGGYCKIAGMVDESMDTKQLSEAPKEWEFRSHPAWQRLLVMAGGVLNNFIFAILSYTMILAIWGQSYIDNSTSEIYVNDTAYEMGFRTGDRILKLDDYVPKNFAMLQADLARREVSTATVLRGTDTVELYIDRAMISEVLNSQLMFDLAVPFVIDSVMATGPNAGTSLKRGDRLVSINGEKVEFLQDSRPVLAGLKGSEVTLGVVRGEDTLTMGAQVDSSGRLGLSIMSPGIKTRKYNILSAVPAGFKMTGSTIGGYLKDLRLLATPSTGAYKSVGSFIAIGEVFPSTWDWYQFLSITALLSIMLAVMNLIPIPGLDGGHILFVLYEMISRRKPSDKFLMIAQMIGMLLLFALMFLALGNDIGRLFR